VHTIWGAHWLGFGTLQLLFLGHVLARPAGADPALGWWFLVFAALIGVCVLAATGENMGLLSVVTLLTGACVVMGLGQLLGSSGTKEAAGYLFAASALCALYTAAALMTEDVRGEPLLPVGRFPCAKRKRPITSGLREPGVTRGQ
jgi:succinate-acetate transporter protein